MNPTPTTAKVEDVREQATSILAEAAHEVNMFNHATHFESPTQRIKGAAMIVEAEFMYTRLRWLCMASDDETFKTRLSKIVDDMVYDLTSNSMAHNSTSMLDNAVAEEQRKAAAHLLRMAEAWRKRVTS